MYELNLPTAVSTDKDKGYFGYMPPNRIIYRRSTRQIKSQYLLYYIYGYMFKYQYCINQFHL